MNDLAQRESIDLSGWWHTWFDDQADAITPPDELEASAPSAGWDGIDEGMESLPVPGTWDSSRPGHHGVAWHWRPFVVPEHWGGRQVTLEIGGVCLWAQVYVNRKLVGAISDGGRRATIDITDRTRAGGRYNLAIRVTNPEPGDANEGMPGAPCAGGVYGAVELVGTSFPSP